MSTSAERMRRMRASQKASQGVTNVTGDVTGVTSLEMVVHKCGICNAEWGGTAFYDGPCPYCKKGNVKGGLAV